MYRPDGLMSMRPGLLRPRVFTADLHTSAARSCRLAHRHRRPERYVGLFGVMAALSYATGISGERDLAQLAARGTALARNLIEQAVGNQGIVVFDSTYTADAIMRALTDGAEHLASLGVLAGAGSYAVSALFGLLLTLVLTPYFMISGPRLAAGAIWLIPPGRRHAVLVLMPKIVPALRCYLIGVVLVVAYTCAVAWIGFGPVFRLPNAVLLALAVGILEMMPVIGPLSSAALVGIVAGQRASLYDAALLVGFVIGL